ncbi:hypothetical protein HDU83_000587 [Entophlyctis luteolus]|nr:hypothetical protein HDU83_000587 [Entophlyctis luteolus]KAJ3389484.1 hypothetical protein HDU84_008707 [Entophlyctis sp. JEL0112]
MESPEWMAPLTWLCSSLAVINVIELVILVAFVYVKEIAVSKNAFTPFNVCLTVMYSSLVAIFICLDSELLGDSSPHSTVIQVFLTATFEQCYVSYCYVRGFPLVAEVHPQFTRMLKCSFYSLPPSLFATPVLVGLTMYTDDQYIQNLTSLLTRVAAIISGCLIIFSDTVILVSFIKYLHRTSINPSCIDKKFIVVSHYGVMSVLLGYLAMVFYVLFVVYSSSRYYIFVCACFSGIATAMGAMKLALYYEDFKKSVSVNVVTAERGRSNGLTVKSKSAFGS